jgi:hypothetical protein
VRVRIVVPASRRSGGRSPHYISPATKFIVIDVFNASHVEVATTSQDLTPGSPGCTPAVGQPVTCTIDIALEAAAYSADVATYDKSGGNVLSQTTGFPFRVVRGVANAISMVLDGVPASVHVVPEPDAVFLDGNQTTGFQMAGLAPQTVDVYGRDADGNVILGAGAPTVSLTADPHVITVTPVGKTNPNQFVLARIASSTSPATLTASAKPANGGTAATATPALAFVPLLYMYQSNGIGEYAPWSNAPVALIAAGLSGAMAVGTEVQGDQILALDGSGNLYAIDTPANHIAVYAPGSTVPARTIASGIDAPVAMAFDSSGTLFVANQDDVTVYAPGSSAVENTVSSGIDLPSALAIDRAGHLFVENFGAANPVGAGNVTEYALAFGTSPIRTITNGVVFPYGIGVDTTGNLYVGSAGKSTGNNTVTVYSITDTAPSNTLSLGPSDILGATFLGGLSVDPAGDMCVALVTEVTCGTVATPFIDEMFGFPSTANYAPAMGFDSSGAFYLLNLQPAQTMERTYAPFADGFTLHPSPTSVVAGNTVVFGFAVQR